MRARPYHTMFVGCCTAIFCLSFVQRPNEARLNHEAKRNDLPVTPRQDWGHFFKELNIDGTFVLYDVQKDEYSAYQPELAQKKHLPASTFKIFNALTALETGAIPDEKTVLRWDGTVHDLPAWNQNQSMDTAFKYSTVWYFQELARRVGKEKMEDWLQKAEYGNKLSGKFIDQFWLNGKLRITPMQQIDFLKRLYFNTLPFSKRSTDIVKQMMLREKNNRYAMYGKTGFIMRENEQKKKTGLGWFVGYVTTQEKTYIFAACLEDDNLFNKELFLNSRINITKNILKSSGIIF
jgi:beta-lactamase class D